MSKTSRIALEQRGCCGWCPTTPTQPRSGLDFVNGLGDICDLGAASVSNFKLTEPKVPPVSNRSALASWEYSRHQRPDVAREFKQIATSNCSERHMLVLLELEVEHLDIKCGKTGEAKSHVFESHLESLLAGLRVVLGLGLCGRKTGSLRFSCS